MIKILVVSDSHGSNSMIKKVMLEEKAQVVLHAGDYCCDISEIKSFVDHVVDGNNDWNGKDFVKIKIEDIFVGLTHGHHLISFSSEKTIKNLKDFANKMQVDLLIFGHTHKEFLFKNDKITILNPGSINYPRNSSIIPSYAIVTVDKKDIKCEIKYINKRH